jgi:autotransporter-associated beta strand protein
LLFVGVAQLGRGQILWSASGGQAWLTGANWTGGAVPSSTQIAQFAVNPTPGTTVGINMNGTTNNGANNQAVGAVEVTSARAVAFLIGNSSASTAGTFTLNGASVNSIANTILRNNSSQLFTLQNTQGSGGSTMKVALNNSTENIINIDGAGNIVISSIISSASGTTPLTLSGVGSGRLDVTGTANTFTGTIKLTGPEARFSADGSFGNVNNAIIIDGGKLATLSAASYTLSSTHNIQVSNAAGTAIITTTSGILTYDGIIADKPSTTGVLTKQGSGTLALGGVSTYTGSTSINSGILQLTTGNDRLPVGTTLNLGQAASANLGTLDLNGRNQTFASINSTAGTNGTASNNTITSASPAILTINGSGSSIYGDGTNANSGVITGAVSIVKSGSGSLTFGDANTYTGTTTVNQGALIVNGTQTGTGAVTVATGATLAGSGTIPGAVSLTGIVSPGNSPGTLSTGAFAFNANSTLQI